MLTINYDKEGDVLEIKFSEVPIEESEYIEETGIVVDYDSNRNIISIEILYFSKRIPVDFTEIPLVVKK